MQQEQTGSTKENTLPRLEIIAALIGARLLLYFCKETGNDIAEAILWSDSTMALGWICNDPNRWKTFVANRVTEIQTYTTHSQWKHCPGENNAADPLSRGVTSEQLNCYKTGGTAPCGCHRIRHIGQASQPERRSHCQTKGRNRSSLDLQQHPAA